MSKLKFFVYIFLIFYIIMSGYILDGSLNITTEISSFEPLVEDISATEVSVIRSAVNLTTSNFNYYIDVSYNINSHISVHHSENTDDDAWSLSEIVINNYTGNNVSIMLPTGSITNINAGVINIYNPEEMSYSEAGLFTVYLDLSINNQGIMSAATKVNGVDVIIETDERVNYAQEIYLENFHTIPETTADTVDTLSKTITTSDVESVYGDALSNIVALYDNKSVITSWNIKINEILQDTNNVLSKHARQNNITTADVFAENAKIVASDYFVYSINITDSSNSNITIASGNVYGVLTQSSQVVA